MSHASLAGVAIDAPSSGRTRSECRIGREDARRHVTRCAAVLSRARLAEVDLGAVEELVVGCLADGRPQIGGWIAVTAGMLRKNALGSLHGPANMEGIVRVSGAELMAWAHSSVSFALMDFGDPSSDWAGELFVQPVGLETLSRAIVAGEQFQPFTSYPEGYLDGLSTLRDNLEQARQSRLAVTVLGVTPSGQFRVTARPSAVIATET